MPQKKDLTQTVKEYLLSHHIGIKKSISMQDLALKCNTNQRMLRKTIEELRQKVPIEGYCIVSHNNGYWLTKDTNEIQQFLHRYLGTAATQFKVAKQTIKQLNRQEQKKIQLMFEF